MYLAVRQGSAVDVLAPRPTKLLAAAVTFAEASHHQHHLPDDADLTEAVRAVFEAHRAYEAARAAYHQQAVEEADRA